MRKSGDVLSEKISVKKSLISERHREWVYLMGSRNKENKKRNPLEMDCVFFVRQGERKQEKKEKIEGVAA